MTITCRQDFTIKGKVMKEWMSRTALLFGEEICEKLNTLRVAVFGVGGVGGYTVEALARSGIFAILVKVLSYPVETKTPAENIEFISQLRQEVAALL